MKKKIQKKYRIFYLIISIFITLFLYYNSHGTLMYGDDLRFHISRVYEIIQNNFQFPYINTHTFQKLGNMVTAFYPSYIMYIFAAIVKILGENYALGSAIFFGFISYLTFIISDYSYRQLNSKKPLASFCFSLLYCFSSYRLNNIYVRYDVGELLAMAFLPALIVGSIQFFNVKQYHYSWWYPNYLFLLGIIGIALSHILSLALSAILILVIIIVNLIHQYNYHKIKLWCQLMINAIYSLLLTSITWIPLLYHYKDLHDKLVISFTNTNNFNSINLQELFKLNINSHQPMSNFYNGSILFCGLIFGLILIIFPKLNTNFNIKICSILSIVYLLLQTNLLPLKIIAPKVVSFIQFPWRFNEFYTPLICIVIIYFIFNTIPQLIRLLNIKINITLFQNICLIIITIITFIHTNNLWSNFYNNYQRAIVNNNVMETTITNQNLATQVQEQRFVIDYLPQKLTQEPKIQNEILYAHRGILSNKIQSINYLHNNKNNLVKNQYITFYPHSSANQLDFYTKNSTKGFRYVVIPIILYNHHYQAKLNNKILKIKLNQQHLLIIKKKPNTIIKKITVKYQTAWYDIIGVIIFSITLLFIIGLKYFYRIRLT